MDPPGRRGLAGALPLRGEVWLVVFDPARGAEIQKTRPAVIVQNDVGNRRSRVTIVAAITSSLEGRFYPTSVCVRAGEGGLDVDSLVMCGQLRTVDKERLVWRLGAMTPRTMERVARALEISLGLVDF